MAVTVVPCKQCGIRTPYTELRSGPNNFWICPSCVNKSAKASASTISAPMNAARPVARPLSNAPEMLPASGMRSYKCEACNYGFQNDRDMSNKMCPYCGQKGGLRLKKSAAQLIKEVSELDL